MNLRVRSYGIIVLTHHGLTVMESSPMELEAVDAALELLKPVMANGNAFNGSVDWQIYTYIYKPEIDTSRSSQ